MTSHKRQADRSQVSCAWPARREDLRQRSEPDCYVATGLGSSQAFNDIFGRPSGAARPAYSHQQGVRPAPAGARPQSYYAGQPYTQLPLQQQQQAYPGAPQPYQHAYTYAGGISSSSRPTSSVHGHDGGNSYGGNALGYPAQMAMAPAMGQGGPATQGQAMASYQSHAHGALPPIPQGSVSTYTPASYLTGVANAQMQSPPPAPQGPAFWQLSDVPQAAVSTGHRASLTNDSTMSSATSHASGHAPRLPSFDLNSGEYNWFTKRSGEYTQNSTPSVTSDDVSPAMASVTLSEQDQYADSDRFYSGNPSAGPSTASSSRRSYTAATTSSAASAYGQELDASEIRDSPGSAISISTAHSGPFADFQQQYPGRQRFSKFVSTS